MSVQQNINIIVVGECGVGKSSFITRVCTGQGVYNHIPTRSIVKSCVDLFSKKIFLIEVPKGQLNDITNIDGIILFFDLNSVSKNKDWVQLLRLRYGNNVPIVLCRNKTDDNYQTKGYCKGQKRDALCISRVLTDYYLELSSKSRYNLHKPIEFILGLYNL